LAEEKQGKFDEKDIKGTESYLHKVNKTGKKNKVVIHSKIS